MSILAQSIIRRTVETLQDTTSIRWPIAELVRYLNDGQREVVLYRPDSMVTNHTITCVAGSKQSLPDGTGGTRVGAKLIEVVRNSTLSTKKAVRLTNREILDAQTPGWHDITGSAEILHYMYDPRDPKVFYVYPPATTAAKLDIVYASYPKDITEPASGALWDDVIGGGETVGATAGYISLPDIYGNVLQDYILYRAYTKDSEYAGNAQRAQAHYAAFANALGIEIKATVAVAPNPVHNPNRTGGASAPQ